MEASFFKNAKNVKISGNSRFNNIVSRGDVHQTNHLGDTHNTNANNKTTTVIKDSYNDNSRHIVNGDASPENESVEGHSSGWTDADSSESSEESDDSERDQRRKARPRAQRKQKPGARSAKAKPRANRRSAQADQGELHSESEELPATPREESPPPEQDDTRPEPQHTVSAPAALTLATPVSPVTASPPPTSASPYLAVPAPQPQSIQTSSSSLTQSVATSPSVPQVSPSQELQRATSAPEPSTASSPFGTSLIVPSVQPLSISVGQIDLAARYRYLVTQSETRYEIRRRLIIVAQSMPKDKFFILKDQAMRANSILELIEGSKEKIQSKEEVVRLALESHAIAFITIMAAETEVPHEKKIFNLLKILNKVEELMDNVVHKKGLSMLSPFKKSENEKLVKSYRKELGTWLKDFQNDKDTTIDFALHKASKALSEALFMEQQYNGAVQEPSAQQTTGSSDFQPQWPGLSPGSTSISDVSMSAVSVGSGSASVINGKGSGEPPAQRASGASLAAPHSKPQSPALSPGSTIISGVPESAVSVGSGSAAVINVKGRGSHRIDRNGYSSNHIDHYRGRLQCWGGDGLRKLDT